MLWASCSPARLFACARYAFFAFAFLTFSSMALYPGGTYRDRNSHGYLFFSNFLSDLGMPQSWANQPNAWGAILFVSGEVALAGGLIAFVVAFLGLSSSVPGVRNWGRAAALIGLIVALALVAAGLTPANRVLSFHIQAALLAFRSAFATAALLAAAIAADRRFPRRALAAAAAVAVVLASYVAVIEWGPRVSSDFGLTFQATAQKLVFLVSIPGLIYLSRAAERVSASAENSSINLSRSRARGCRIARLTSIAARESITSTEQSNGGRRWCCRRASHPGIETNRRFALHGFVHDRVAPVDRLSLVPDDRHGDIRQPHGMR